MKREWISQALNLLDDRHIGDTASFDPGAMQKPPERILHMKKKRLISLVLAAVLILSFGISAFAAYSSVATPQAAEKVAREQIAVWKDLGILCPEVVFEGAADNIVEIEEETGGTSWYGRIFPHSYSVRWYCNRDGAKYGCALQIDTLAGKIRMATIFAEPDENDKSAGEITVGYGPDQAETWFYYENFDDLFPADMTLDDFCKALAQYWGYDGYRLANEGDKGYTNNYRALYGEVDGSTRMVDLPRNNTGTCFLMVFFDGDQEGAPVYLDLMQYPGYVGVDIGIRHPVG